MRVAYGRLFVWLRPILMVRRIFQVAFLALTLNTRRDDRYSTADERAAQAQDEQRGNMVHVILACSWDLCICVDRGKRRPTLFNARTKCELRPGAYLFWSHRRLTEQKAQAAAQTPPRQHHMQSKKKPTMKALVAIHSPTPICRSYKHAKPKRECSSAACKRKTITTTAANWNREERMIRRMQQQTI
jgi:hypothetical protein